MGYLRHNGACGGAPGDTVAYPDLGSWTIYSENQYKKHDICKKNIVFFGTHLCLFGLRFYVPLKKSSVISGYLWDKRLISY